MSKKKADKKIDPYALICKPLDNYSDILLFLENPPPWRTLCQGMTPHSNTVIKNVDINKHYDFRTLEIPENFCHFSPDVEEAERCDPNSVPKTLVCHDMANGYHDDCIIDGTVNYQAYTFYNWAGIDIFCYFSHHLITIPPVGWINVGHAHGVKVIGTIITEWAEGTTFWDIMLASEEQYQNLASALVAIAKTLKFDGYLLNIENKVLKPEALLEFVKYLHRLLHEELEYAVLVWYDSVTVQGNLNWQNGLTDKNKAFFDVCDGFFTNYSWTPENVTSSAEMAGDRVTDLFIGIDVWGRNFYGGGQFNTQEAIKVAQAPGCSLAIFAPAWTHEAMSWEETDKNDITMAEDLDFYDQFLLRDRALWGSIWPFLNTRVPCQMPFQTSFCRGQGKSRRMYGEVLSPAPWFNLRHQQYQPNAAHGPHGYLLSSAETIRKGRHTAQYKDKKGIIRYRINPLARHQEIADRPYDNLSVKSNDSYREGDVSQTDSLDSTNKSDDIRADSETKSVKKTKINAFINLFKQKPVKLSDGEHNLDETTVPEEGSSSSTPEPTKISMIHELTSSEAGSTSEAQSTLEPGITVKTGGTLELDSVLEPGNTLEPESTFEPVNKLEPGSTFEPGTALEPRSTLEAGSLQDLNEDTAGPSVRMRQISMNLRLGSPAGKTRFCLAHVEHERECLELHFKDAFTGGTCLKINPCDELQPEHRFTRLFYCDFECEDTLIFCVVTKPLRVYSEQTLNVNLLMKNAAGADLSVVLTGRDVVQTVRLDGASAGVTYVYPLDTRQARVLTALRTYLLLHEPGFYVPIDNCYGWSVRYYEVTVPGSRITSINLRTGLPQGGILLGHFGVCRKNKDLLKT